MFQITIVITKILYRIINYLNIGSGYAWPGKVALRIYPNILIKLAKILPKDIIFVTGTNGKTTTAKLITHIFKKHGWQVVSNITGGNLVNGIVSTILLNTNYRGEFITDRAVFEADELALPLLLEFISPKVLVLLNLSRDQLDRYWELDFTLEKWQKAFESIKDKTKFIVYDNQDDLKNLFKHIECNLEFFDESDKYLNKTKLLGKHNAQNLNCALLVAKSFDIDISRALSYLDDFECAYGRGEEIVYKKRKFRIFLAKNPASFNSNLDLVLNEKLSFDTILFILNDNIPDGRDVSWIYDIDFEPLLEVTKQKIVYVSGLRAADMLIRLKYAGLDDAIYEEKIRKAVNKICSDSKSSRIIVLPNYSAMLQFRKILKGRGIL